LTALSSLAPFLLEVYFQWYAGLAGQMGYDLGDNIFAVLWKAPIEMNDLAACGEVVHLVL
jgi:hypothetical protein